MRTCGTLYFSLMAQFFKVLTSSKEHTQTQKIYMADSTTTRNLPDFHSNLSPFTSLFHCTRVHVSATPQPPIAKNTNLIRKKEKKKKERPNISFQRTPKPTGPEIRVDILRLHQPIRRASSCIGLDRPYSALLWGCSTYEYS